MRNGRRSKTTKETEKKTTIIEYVPPVYRYNIIPFRTACHVRPENRVTARVRQPIPNVACTFLRSCNTTLAVMRFRRDLSVRPKRLFIDLEFSTPCNSDVQYYPQRVSPFLLKQPVVDVSRGKKITIENFDE